jgi:hypothetical protein
MLFEVARTIFEEPGIYATAMKNIKAPPKKITFVTDSMELWSALRLRQTVPIMIAKPVYIITLVPDVTRSR